MENIKQTQKQKKIEGNLISTGMQIKHKKTLNDKKDQ